MVRRACTTTSHFLDVNVLIALAHEIHPQNRVALWWVRSLGRHDGLHYCRFTQLGMLRLFTNKSAMGDEVFSQKTAWLAHDYVCGSLNITLLQEPIGAESVLRRLTEGSESSPRLWADAYLAAFAEADGLTLVTFDRALAMMAPGAILLGTLE